MATKKSAKVDFRAYETESVGKRFENIRKQLIVDCCHVSLTNANLALLTANLIQLNDDILGRDASSVTRQTTKLPMKLFHDYKPNGSVYYMVWTHFQTRGTFRYTKLVDHEAVRLLKRFHDGLLKAGHLKYPEIVLSSEFDAATREELTALANGHGATVAKGRSATTTHVVVPEKGPVLDESKDYLRVLQTRGNLMLIHWLYHPDSYDTWLTTNDVEGTAPPPKPPPTGVQTVTAKWLKDLNVFNEWMNEQDYLPEVTSEPKQYKKADASATALGKRPQSSVNDGAKKQKTGTFAEQKGSWATVGDVRKVASAGVHSYAGEAGGRLGGRTRKFATQPNLRYTNISWADGKHVKLNVPKGSVVAKAEACAWFSYESIHEIERRGMPEFFDGRSASKTPEVYMDYRNFMVQAYEQNPTQYLTQTAVRRNLAGDVCAICRVHAFLEHWGLINYRVNPDMFPVPAPSVPKDAQAALRDLVRFTKKPDVHQSFVLHKNAFLAVYATCGSCGVECGQNRHHSEKGGGVDLCPACFTAGKYDRDLSAADFTQVRHEREEQEEWTDQETLLMLHAIERYPDDWEAVASHVGTKTKEQCVRHFVTLPIEDSFLESDLAAAGVLPCAGAAAKEKGAKKEKTDDEGECESKEEEEQEKEEGEEEEEEESSGPAVDKSTAEYLKQVANFPFAEARNPVMSLVAFLASTVDPSVAAAAAQAALSAVMRRRKSKEGDKASPAEDPNAPQPMELEESIAREAEKSVEDPIRAAAATALAEATVRAQLLVQKEEMEMEKLAAQAIDLELKKLELKLEKFHEIEKHLQKEREQAQKQAEHDLKAAAEVSAAS
eukprot:CAMPEP_0114609804 /NCGR_PEP_ID=MMETSP0168-20121206/3274_1 /TAXON_ID=95228 ORGANISM="Vannella sp., Strain DIVA3 517/6/12" /NCGR_SAMPLE_ID=MMETSP0168 /ASSEMBLY_ACC=CAM_ASM_000044 /LENGTH=834 /DNA_ID=CAMNT_0001820727 /DNA_START=82 /DNA_END=2583 /DNA_ORIENTATION=+